MNTSSRAIELLRLLERDEGGLFLPPAYHALDELARHGLVRSQPCRYEDHRAAMITEVGRRLVGSGRGVGAENGEVGGEAQ